MNTITIPKEKENDTEFLNDVEQMYYFKYLYLKTYGKKIEQNTELKNI